MKLLPLLLALPLLAQEDPKQAPTVIDKPFERGVGKAIAPGSAIQPLLNDSKALVVVFAAAECPVAKLYKPKLDRMEKEWAPKGVKLFVAGTDDAALVKMLDARRTPEAFVLDPKGVVRYRGAIDDQYGIGYQRDQATKHYLTDAIDAVLAGKAPSVLATEAPGCPIEGATVAAPAGASKASFHKDVAPILQKRCADCHRPGEIGPFPLLTYADAKKHARKLKEAVTAKRMPPWHADPKHGEWANDRHLSDAEIRTISGWVDAGTPEGSSKDAPAPRKFVEGWTIGTPDVVYKIPRPERIPAEGTIPYKYVNVKTDLKEDRWVQAMEVRAGAKEVVHHILVFIMFPLNRLREQPPLDGGLQGGYFAILVPGESPMVFAEGQGKLVPGGATLVFQIHYTAVGKAVEDQSSIGIVWAKKPAKQEVLTRGIVNTFIKIPPGADNHKEEATFTFDSDSKILGLLPHMHVRGKSFSYTLIGADGKEQVLLDVPRYDFNWQTCYRPKEPIAVKKGARIRAVAHYDNSKNNPANPDPTKEVKFGQQTWDEMFIGYVDFVKVSP
jgi:mono/diheme cytochrome c family protein